MRLAALLALRRAKYPDATDVLRKCLADPDEQVRLMAMVWIGEEKITLQVVLLLGVGFTGELVYRKVRSSNSRIAILVVLLIALLLIWAELAVGIFGSPFAGS